MIKTLGLVAARGAMLAGAIAITAPVFAQAPTDAQREAIRSACRSDYIAHCSSVPPGGRRIAAVPAEEHVEPVGRLQKCGECGERGGETRGTGSSGAGCTQSRHPRGCRACQAGRDHCARGSAGRRRFQSRNKHGRKKA